MRNLKLTAEKTMDLYYQEYKHKDDFFDLEDFIFYCSVGYAFLLQEEFEESYKQSKQELGENRAELNPEWFTEQIIQVQHNLKSGDYEATLPVKPFSFRFDRSYSSVGDIESTTTGCTDFVRSGANRNWLIKRLPTNPKIFWFLRAGKIVFKNVKCSLKEVRVFLVPSLSELSKDAPIPESLEDGIIRRTLDLMFQAKQGMPVLQMSSDENPNKIMQTEINPNYNLKTTQRVQ